jgi:hypothetical protein
MLTSIQIQHVEAYRLEVSFHCKLSKYQCDISKTTFVGMQVGCEFYPGLFGSNSVKIFVKHFNC